jgi:UDP-N-acetylmuramate dehydrogenase
MISIQENVPLSELTTFKIGGSARYFVAVENEEDVRAAVLWARGKSIPIVVLSGGSNVLISDDGIDALVLYVTSRVNVFEGSRLIADAGCSLLEMIKKASMLGLGGWESLAGIPGSIGGAIRGNAGAFGTEIKDVLESVLAFNTSTFTTETFLNEQCDFSYRHSFFKDNPDWIILRVTVKLQRVEAEKSLSRINDTIIERERRHLQNVQAAGSFFTNPKAPDVIQAMFEQDKKTQSREGRVPAGWLIEKVGMKGAKVGGAIASEQHPNYLVNTGNATAKDVLELARQIKEAVKTRFSITLEEEAAVVG